MEDGVHHVNTERTGVGGSRLPSDVDHATSRNTCWCVECQRRHERESEGSKGSDSSEHIEVVNGVRNKQDEDVEDDENRREEREVGSGRVEEKLKQVY